MGGSVEDPVQADLRGPATHRVSRIGPPNPEVDKWHLKETVKHDYYIKPSVKVNYKIYESLIERASGERSGRGAAGEAQTVVR